MANVAATLMTGAGSRAITRTTLTASDTFTYDPHAKQVLVLDNVTAGALTVTIDGAGGTTVPVAGVGDVSVASGYSTGSLAAGVCVAIPLDSIAKFLQGTIAVTGGTGIKASLLSFA